MTPRSSRAPRATARRCSPRARPRLRCGPPTPPPSARRPTPPTVACISRPPTWCRISTARWKRRRRRACCARSSPTRRRFAVHDPLPAAAQFGDEGAANHTRFASDAAARPASSSSSTAGWPTTTARELAIALSGAPDARSLAGDRAAARPRPGAHLVRPAEPGSDRRRRVPQRRDRGRQRGGAVLPRERVRRAGSACSPSSRPHVGAAFTPIVVRAADVSVERAVATYLFNSQLLTRADGGMLLVAPAECAEDPSVGAYLARLVAVGRPDSRDADASICGRA